MYKWPEDLLKPDLVLLLTVSPEERARRLEGRGLERTKEEAELEANSLFRQRYTLMKGKRMEAVLVPVKSVTECLAFVTGTRIPVSLHFVEDFLVLFLLFGKDSWLMRRVNFIISN